MLKSNPIKLPVRPAKQPAHLVCIQTHSQLAVAVLKKQIIAAMNNKQGNIDLSEIEEVLLSVWNNGYNRGLKDMDRMHGRADAIRTIELTNKSIIS